MQKELLEKVVLLLLGNEASSATTLPLESGVLPEVGQYVLVRSRNEGINCGFVVAADETGILLKNARRLYYHRPAVQEESWYEGVCRHGLAVDCKVSPPVQKKGILEDYSWCEMTSTAAKSVQEYKSHAQS